MLSIRKMLTKNSNKVKFLATSAARISRVITSLKNNHRNRNKELHRKYPQAQVGDFFWYAELETFVSLDKNNNWVASSK